MTVARAIVVSLFILLITTASPLAQRRPSIVATIPIVCMSPDDAVSFVGSYGETLFWTGQVMKDLGSERLEGVASLFVNQSNGSWTYIETYQAVACIISIGDKSRQIDFGPPT